MARSTDLLLRVLRKLHGRRSADRKQRGTAQPRVRGQSVLGADDPAPRPPGVAVHQREQAVEGLPNAELVFLAILRERQAFLKLPPQLSQQRFGLLPTYRSRKPQVVAQRVPVSRVCKLLRVEVIAARPERPKGQLRIVVSRHHDNGQVRAPFPKRMQQLQAGGRLVPEAAIQQHHIEVLAIRQHGLRRFPVASIVHVLRISGNRFHDDVPACALPLVVEHEDPVLPARQAAPASCVLMVGEQLSPRPPLGGQAFQLALRGGDHVLRQPHETAVPPYAAHHLRRIHARLLPACLLLKIEKPLKDTRGCAQPCLAGLQRTQVDSKCANNVPVLVAVASVRDLKLPI